MSAEGLKIKLLLDNKPELVELIEGAESRNFEVVLVCQSIGFDDDPQIHRQVVEYLATLGCRTHLVADGRPDRGLAGVREAG